MTETQSSRPNQGRVRTEDGISARTRRERARQRALRALGALHRDELNRLYVTALREIDAEVAG